MSESASPDRFKVGRSIQFTPIDESMFYDPDVVLTGTDAVVRRLNPARAARELAKPYFDAPATFTYLDWGPFRDSETVESELLRTFSEMTRRTNGDAFFMVERDGVVVGVVSLLRVNLSMGSVEIGNVVFSPQMRKSRASSQVHILLTRWLFVDLRCRRVEWKCDSFNGPSQKAAKRLGFRFEGTFRNHTVYKGRSRDTRWFSITAEEYDGYVRTEHDRWNDDSNFNSEGKQKSPLRVSHEASPDWLEA